MLSCAYGAYAIIAIEVKSNCTLTTTGRVVRFLSVLITLEGKLMQFLSFFLQGTGCTQTFATIFIFTRKHRIFTCFYITYIIGRQDYWPSFSHTQFYIYIYNYIHKWRDLQFKVDSERQIFWEPFITILFTLRVFHRNLLRGNRRRNIFRISFRCLAWGLNPGFSPISQHTTY